MNVQYAPPGKDSSSMPVTCVQALKHCSAFETMIAEISARAEGLENTYKFLTDCAELMGLTVRADGVVIMHYDAADETLIRAAEWSAETGPTLRDRPRSAPLDTFSWWRTLILHNQMVRYGDTRELQNAADRERLLRYGIKSLLAIPIPMDGLCYGFAGFETYGAPRRWTEEEADILNEGIRIISMALENRTRDEGFRVRARFLENILDAMPERICVIDREQTVLLVNKAFRGVHRTNLKPGDLCYKIFHGYNEACEVCPLFEGWQTLTPRTFVRRAGHGGTGWEEVLMSPYFDTDGTPAGVVKRVREVTDRVNAQKELEESRKYFQALADYTCAWESLIGPDGQLVYISPFCETICGYSREQFLEDPKLFSRMTHPEDRHLLKDDLHIRALADGPKSAELRIHTLEGRTCWIKWNSRPVILEDDFLLGIRVSIQDITPQKKAEQAHRETLKDLEQQVEIRTSELKEANEKLARTNQELNEVNKALSLLARTVGKTQEESHRNLALGISSRVMPVLARLEHARDLNNHRVDLQCVASELRQVTSVFGDGMKSLMGLSPTEMQVALMIKNGLTTRQIAAQMNVSVHTVKSHRRNIRGKMGLKDEKTELGDYLSSTSL